MKTKLKKIDKLLNKLEASNLAEDSIIKNSTAALAKQKDEFNTVVDSLNLEKTANVYADKKLRKAVNEENSQEEMKNIWKSSAKSPNNIKTKLKLFDPALLGERDVSQILACIKSTENDFAPTEKKNQEHVKIVHASTLMANMVMENNKIRASKAIQDKQNKEKEILKDQMIDPNQFSTQHLINNLRTQVII